MGQIRNTDILFATLVQQGRTVGTYRISGVSSLSALLKGLRQMAAQCFGLVTLTLHNTTQGWRRAQSLVFGQTEAQRWQNPVQLSLF